MFSEKKKMVKEETEAHRTPIIHIEWHHTGKNMLTCDSEGLISVWKGINVISVYQNESPITHAIFADIRLGNAEEQQKLKKKILFFFGGTNGIVSLADDSNHCNELCKVGGSIKTLLFYEPGNSIIIITTSLLLV